MSGYESIPVTAEEEEAWKALELKTAHWVVYANGYRTYNAYNTLAELCADMSVDEKTVMDAITHHQGVWGAFRFIAKTH